MSWVATAIAVSVGSAVMIGRQAEDQAAQANGLRKNQERDAAVALKRLNEKKLQDKAILERDTAKARQKAMSTGAAGRAGTILTGPNAIGGVGTSSGGIPTNTLLGM